MRARVGLVWMGAVALVSFAVPATAQSSAPAFPTWEVTGGYQLLHVPDETLPFGLNLDGAINVSKAFGLAGEAGWITDSIDESGVTGRVHGWHIGAGPRLTARPMGGRVWPYAQLFAGVLHVRTSMEVDGVDVDVPSETRFMLQPGGGVNINAGDGWGVVVAADYRRVFLDEDEDGESGENQFRLFVGIRLLLD